MEPYRHEIGKQFGKRVPGVFTDDRTFILPAICRGVKSWPGIPEALGYDSLITCQPDAAVGDWRKVRHNYFQVLNEQFIEHWSKPYHDYCETNRLEWTGHYWDHEWPNCVGVPTTWLCTLGTNGPRLIV